MKLWDSVTTQLFSVHQPCARFLLRKQFLLILRFSQSSAFLFKLIIYLFILAVLCGIWDLSSLTRDQTYTLCNGSADS